MRVLLSASLLLVAVDTFRLPAPPRAVLRASTTRVGVEPRAPRAAGADSGSKVPVVLPADLALRVEVKAPPTISPAMIAQAVEKLKVKPYKLEDVRVAEEGGTQPGHTIIARWNAKDVETQRALAGASFDKVEILLGDGPDAHPFSEGVLGGWDGKRGMGQMELKVFEVEPLPEDFEVESMRGVRCAVELLVYAIKTRVDNPPDTRDDATKSKDAEAVLTRTIAARTNASVDAALKEALLAACTVDSDVIVESVSWAKFGEKSLTEFKWSCIKEKIVSAHNLDNIEEVPVWLRSQADVVYV